MQHGLFVAQHGKTIIKRIKPDAEVGTGIAIESALTPGVLVVVNGTQSLRAGAAVVATPISGTLKTSLHNTDG